MERNIKIIQLIRKMATIRCCFLDRFVGAIHNDEIRIKVLTLAFDQNEGESILRELDELLRMQGINKDFRIFLQIDTKQWGVSWGIPKQRPQSIILQEYENNLFHLLITLKS